MCEVKIVERIVVDEPENVVRAIYNLTGKRSDFEVIRKFIISEKDTMFYLDKKMNSSTDPGHYSDYLWLDTGYRDHHNSPIMICLHNSLNGYIGHYTGTIKELAGNIKSLNRKYRKDIDRNFSRFISKYKSRAEERMISYIVDEQEYAIMAANRDTLAESETTIGAAMKQAGIAIIEELVEEKEEEVTEEKEEDLTEAEQEITIGLLVDQMQKMQDYIDELMHHIEHNEKESQEEINALKSQNKEYKDALLNIRMYMDNEKKEVVTAEKVLRGHNLLEKNEKILVLGNTDIRIDEMRAIARDNYGFEKTDFEFITDYDKVKSYGNRIHNSERFVAVIFGNCPHKVAGIGKYASIIDEFKTRTGCPLSIDARTQAGGLKITKQSFRAALYEVFFKLKEMKAA